MAILADFLLDTLEMTATGGVGDAERVQSRPVQTAPGYRTLLGRVRANVRGIIAKQLALPRQEIGEILAANLRAAKWLAIALVFALLFLIALVALVIALLSLVLPGWAAALVVLVACGALAAVCAYVGYRRLELRGPTRSIESVKETIRWAKARLLGRSAS
ncbi:MAG: phage holin family protein [Candidatus Limnocylindria bacterium]